jgi:hypothetical protein
MLFGQAGQATAAAYFATGPMGAARQDHTATLLNDGTVLVAGGISTSAVVLDTAEIYDPSTGNFTPTAGPMTEARQNHTATRLNDGRVLITGGRSGSTFRNSAEIYDPATKTFTPTKDVNLNTVTMTGPRWVHTATLLGDGKVLIAGGRSGSLSSSTLRSAELYDPVTGQFVATTDQFAVITIMTDFRAFHTATLLSSGKVLLTGGLKSGSTSLDSAEIYDPATGLFTETGNTMLVARNYHAAVLLPNGTVLVTGGTSGSAGVSHTSAEIYDPTADAFGEDTITMTSRHSRHAAVLLADGTVLVAGDFSDVGLPGGASEVFVPYDGETGTPAFFIPRDPMPTPRSHFSAVRLANGTVLLAGGASGFPGVPATLAELYNPSAARVTPAGHTFPATVVGSTSAAQTFTISTNAGLAIAPFSLTGTNGAMFTVSGTSCSTQQIPPPNPENPPPPSLEGGQSCTVDVTFSPTSAGAKFASLVITTDDLSIPVWEIPLSGTGVAPSPPTVTTSFAVGSMSAGDNTNLTVTIGNANVGAISLTSAFTDTLPTGMTINTAGNAGTCTGVTATAGAGSFTMASGTAIPVGGCTVVVNVTSSVVGSAVNTIAAGALQTTAGSNALPASAMLDVTASALTLTVEYGGDGDGSVNSAPSGIACSDKSESPCQGQFGSGEPVILTAAGDSNSLFGGWSASCGATNPCEVTPFANMSITATFTYVKPAKTSGVGYDTLQLAYDNAGIGGMVQARDHTFTESPVFNGSGLVTINGGYDLNYSTNSGTYSVVDGVLTVGTGGVVLSNIVVQ